MKPKTQIVIVSAGKFAREVCGWIGHAIAAGANWEVKGFLDDRPHLLDGKAYPGGILGAVESYQPMPEDRFFCPIGDISRKKQYCRLIEDKGGQFTSLIHPTAAIGSNVQLGKGVMIAPFVMLGADAMVGDFASIGPYCCVSHDNVVGNWCQMSSHCNLGGNVEVGSECFFGLSAVVAPMVKIQENCFIGAGSVVLRDVRANTKVFGNPALPIGSNSPVEP